MSIPINITEALPVHISKQSRVFFEKSGFIVVQCITLLSFIRRFTVLGIGIGILFIPYILICFLTSVIIQIFFGTIEQILIIFIYGGVSIYLIFLLITIIGYFRGKYLFLSSEGIVAFFRWYPKGETNYLKWYNLYSLSFSEAKKILKKGYPRIYKFLVGIVSLACLFLAGLLIKGDSTGIIKLLIFLVTGFLCFQICIAICVLCMDRIISLVYPIISFGRLGYRLQELTPKISENSKKIQSEFEKDMNFAILHTGFEGLSSIFLSIMKLVLQIEKIENRVNKGNLFDSTKYIASIHAEVLIPLIELQEFFKKQRGNLLNTEKMISEIKIKGDSLSGNIDLQYKRINLLLQKIDSKIIILDDMIQKMRQSTL